MRCNGCDSSGNSWYFANQRHKWGVDAGVCYDHADKPEYVFITHKHTDHWDLTAVNYLKKTHVKIIEDELDENPSWAFGINIPHNSYNWTTGEYKPIETRMWKIDKLVYITDCQSGADIMDSRLMDCEIAIVECNHRNDKVGLQHRSTAVQHMSVHDCLEFIYSNLYHETLIILSHVSHDNITTEEREVVIERLNSNGYKYVIWAKAGQLVYWDETTHALTLR